MSHEELQETARREQAAKHPHQTGERLEPLSPYLPPDKLLRQMRAMSPDQLRSFIKRHGRAPIDARLQGRDSEQLAKIAEIDFEAARLKKEVYEQI